MYCSGHSLLNGPTCTTAAQSLNHGDGSRAISVGAATRRLPTTGQTANGLHRFGLRLLLLYCRLSGHLPIDFSSVAAPTGNCNRRAEDTTRAMAIIIDCQVQWQVDCCVCGGGRDVIEGDQCRQCGFQWYKYQQTVTAIVMSSTPCFDDVPPPFVEAIEWNEAARRQSRVKSNQLDATGA